MRMKTPVRGKKRSRPAMWTRFTHAVGTRTAGVSTRTSVLAVVGTVAAAVVIGKAASNPSPAMPPAPKPSVSTTIDTAAVIPPIEVPARSSAGQHQAAAVTTLTGCLERDSEAFRLKDTSGTSAPKARSWKSGFLKKGPAPVAIVDPAKALRLPAHVGERVSVTGTMVDREMRVRSLRRVAASCSAKS
jgi:hypothetical protein